VLARSSIATGARGRGGVNGVHALSMHVVCCVRNLLRTVLVQQYLVRLP